MVVLRAGGREQGSGCWAQGAGYRAQGTELSLAHTMPWCYWVPALRPRPSGFP